MGHQQLSNCYVLALYQICGARWQNGGWAIKSGLFLRSESQVSMALLELGSVLACSGGYLERNFHHFRQPELNWRLNSLSPQTLFFVLRTF